MIEVFAINTNKERTTLQRLAAAFLATITLEYLQLRCTLPHSNNWWYTVPCHRGV
ncbi:hypothetical protein ABEW49_21660 [Bacillus anthracis]|uniref:hypothetical protein n=1 Tax=Bacillus anthracis TaxID=1392 RepID=UPI003D1C9A6A